MKKGIALILGLTIWVSGTSTVMAEENISEVNSVYTCQNTYESRLPLEVTYDITLGEIEEDILNYIAFNKLDVVYGSDQYLELLNEFTFYPADNTWFCRRMIHSLQADDTQFSLVRNPNSSYTIK